MPANKKLKWQVPFLLVLIVSTVLILRKQAPYQTDQGLVFGINYHSHQQQHEQHSRQYVYPCLPVVQINLGRNTRSI